MVITRPPENTTVCRSTEVTISCGYASATAVPVTWIINGMSFDEASLMDNPLYQLDNPTINPPLYSLTVFSINHITTFQCIVHATNNQNKPVNITSTRGAVTVIGMYVCTYVYTYLLHSSCGAITIIVICSLCTCIV